MLRLKSRARPITVLGVLVLCAGTSYTAEIGGQISGTLTITEDSELVDDVSCTVTGAACIVIGASHVTLDLNGFTVTGQGDAQTGCSGTSTGGEIEINVSNQKKCRYPRSRLSAAFSEPRHTAEWRRRQQGHRSNGLYELHVWDLPDRRHFR